MSKGWVVSKEWDCGSTRRRSLSFFPKNGKRGGCPRIPDGEGDKSDSAPPTPKNKWVAAISLKNIKIR